MKVACYRLARVLASVVLPAADVCAGPCSVAVDVGHFLVQPGALSARGTPEFQFNLALAREVRGALERHGCEVVMIGEDGNMRNLRTRAAAASGAALFVSIHHDSVKPPTTSWWCSAPLRKRLCCSSPACS